MNKYSFNPENYEKELIGITKGLLRLAVPGGRQENLSRKHVDKVIKSFPQDGNKMFGRDKILTGLKWVFVNDLVHELTQDKLVRISQALKLKPTRTESGVTTVTVLTKPFACPGQCVFCPNDVRMPKSYIATEPGAQRALMNRFSPYLQTYNRLKALRNIGHPTSKIELLVLGGTWSYYPEKYRVWFISECFRAMNEFGSEEVKDQDNEFKGDSVDLNEYLKEDYNKELRAATGDKPYNQLLQTEKFKKDFEQYIAKENYELRITNYENKNPVSNLNNTQITTNKFKTVLQNSKLMAHSSEPIAYGLQLEAMWNNLYKLQIENSKGNCKNVGLVLETRPDVITPEEVLKLRMLGATKIQLGIQTLDDKISDLNKRGEHREHTSKAFNLLRAGGFKIHAHIMPNLYGSTPEIDLQVYKELFSDENYKPDELKIYPTSIVKNTELDKYYKEGKYTPYSTETLVNLIADCMEATPEYCRLTRVIRDIPSTEIEAGNMTTNLREVVEHKLKVEGRKNPNIRAREIKNKNVKFEDLTLDIIEYETATSTEYFLQYITEERQIAGFLRLSIPDPRRRDPGIAPSEISACAIIREVHVYGPSLEFAKDSSGEAQHLGLGSKLIEKSKEISKEKGFEKLAVISAIGTREYYEKRRFKLDKYYQIANI